MKVANLHVMLVADQNKKRRRKRQKGKKITHYKIGNKRGRVRRSDKTQVNGRITPKQPKADLPEASVVSDSTSGNFDSTSIRTVTGDTTSQSEVSSILESSSTTSEATTGSHNSASHESGILNTPTDCHSEESVLVSPPASTMMESVADCLINLTPERQSEVIEDYCVVPDCQLIADVVSKLQRRIVLPWLILSENDGINVVLLSRNRARAIQRSIFFSFDGKEEEVTVHQKKIPDNILKDILDKSESPRQIALTETCVDEFVERIVTVVKKLCSYEVCVGVNDSKYRCLWDVAKSGRINENLFCEARYTNTFRPFTCNMLVPTQKFLRHRCHVCIKTKIGFKEKLKHYEKVQVHPCTPNVHLDRNQLIHKVEKQQKDLQYARAQIARLKEELKTAVERDGIVVDEE